MTRLQIHTRIDEWLLIAVMVTLPWSLRINAFLLGLWFLNWLIEGQWRNKFSNPPGLFRMASWAFFLLLALRCLGEADPALAFKVTERKAAFLLIPLLSMGSRNRKESANKNAALYFNLSMILFFTYCLSEAISELWISGDSSVFFYHRLVAPLDQHAVYISALCLLNLITVRRYVPGKVWLFLHLIFFVFLLLLSSKLMMALYGLYTLYQLLAYMGKGSLRRVYLWIPVAVTLLVLTIPNPLRTRYLDISPERLQYITQEHIGQEVYLDGLSLRLLQLRFAAEILNDEQAWLYGVGQLNTQQLLDESYRSVDLYTPDSPEDNGYLGYNFHNQFAESIVQGGIPVFLALCLVFAGLMRKAVKDKNRDLLFTSLLFVLFCLTESVFERQLGVVSFLVFSYVNRQSGDIIQYVNQTKETSS